MPFESKAQAAWMFANKPEMAREWASKTKSIKKLPVRKGAGYGAYIPISKIAPRIMYHGTDAGAAKKIIRNGFRTDRNNLVWMTPDKRAAAYYAKRKNPRIVESMVSGPSVEHGAWDWDKAHLYKPNQIVSSRSTGLSNKIRATISDLYQHPMYNAPARKVKTSSFKESGVGKSMEYSVVMNSVNKGLPSAGRAIQAAKKNGTYQASRMTPLRYREIANSNGKMTAQRQAEFFNLGPHESLQAATYLANRTKQAGKRTKKYYKELLEREAKTRPSSSFKESGVGKSMNQSRFGGASAVGHNFELIEKASKNTKKKHHYGNTALGVSSAALTGGALKGAHLSTQYNVGGEAIKNTIERSNRNIKDSHISGLIDTDMRQAARAHNSLPRALGEGMEALGRKGNKISAIAGGVGTAGLGAAYYNRKKRGALVKKSDAKENLKTAGVGLAGGTLGGAFGLSADMSSYHLPKHEEHIKNSEPDKKIFNEIVRNNKLKKHRLATVKVGTKNWKYGLTGASAGLVGATGLSVAARNKSKNASIKKADKDHYTEKLLRQMKALSEQAKANSHNNKLSRNPKFLIPVSAATGAAIGAGTTAAVKKDDYDQMGQPVQQKKRNPLSNMSGNAKLGTAGGAIGLVGAKRMAFAGTLPGALKSQADAAEHRVKFEERMATAQNGRVQQAATIRNPITRRRQVRMHGFYADKAASNLASAESKKIMADNALKAAPAKKLAHLKSGGALVATGAALGGLAAYNNAKEHKTGSKVK